MWVGASAWFERARVYSDRHLPSISERRHVCRWRCVADGVRKKSGDVRPHRAHLVVAPKHNSLSPQPPKLPAQEHIFLIHVHENGIVLFSESPDVFVEAPDVSNPHYPRTTLGLQG